MTLLCGRNSGLATNAYALEKRRRNQTEDLCQQAGLEYRPVVHELSGRVFRITLGLHGFILGSAEIDLRVIWESSGDHLGIVWGSSRGRLGIIWGSSGVIWGYLGVICGSPGGYLGVTWGHLRLPKVSHWLGGRFAPKWILR